MYKTRVFNCLRSEDGRRRIIRVIRSIADVGSYDVILEGIDLQFWY